MPATFCKFTFSEEVSKAFLDDAIACSVFLAEHAFGRARVRIDTAYATADDPPRCLIDASSDVGRFVAEQLAETMMKLKGERSFDVTKVDQWKL